ncbi:homoserine dehydrogenase, partial [Candidatus Woesearchaeota archaeon CG11_big_fil_rev_8_21_14_0_20_57_5]
EAAFEYYLRHTVLDTPGVLHKISGILAEHNISIADVVQVGRNEDEPIPLIIRTHLSKEKAMMDALHKIDALDVVKDATVLIRNEG